MTIRQAKESGFTHKGVMYGFIKVFCKNVDDFEPIITGTNFLYDSILFIISFIDEVLNISESFSVDNLESI